MVSQPPQGKEESVVQADFEKGPMCENGVLGCTYVLERPIKTGNLISNKEKC